MRKLLAGTLSLALSSCSAPWWFHPVNSNYAEIDHLGKKPPSTFAFLGQANQICLEWRKDTAPVDIFVIPKHPGLVKLVVNEEYVYRLAGDSVHLTLERVGKGQFKVDVYLDEEYQLTLTFSVWDCGPKDNTDRNLYRPTKPGEPGGLKGYCPECECTTPE